MVVDVAAYDIDYRERILTTAVQRCTTCVVDMHVHGASLIKISTGTELCGGYRFRVAEPRRLVPPLLLTSAPLSLCRLVCVCR